MTLKRTHFKCVASVTSRLSYSLYLLKSRYTIEVDLNNKTLINNLSFELQLNFSKTLKVGNILLSSIKRAYNLIFRDECKNQNCRTPHTQKHIKEKGEEGGYEKGEFAKMTLRSFPPPPCST